MSRNVDRDRRLFLAAAATSVAGGGLIGSARAQSATKGAGNTSFAAIRQIEAGLLNVGYAEAYEHQVVKGGVGHNLPQEAPKAFAQAVVDVDRF